MICSGESELIGVDNLLSMISVPFDAINILSSNNLYPPYVDFSLIIIFINNVKKATPCIPGLLLTNYKSTENSKLDYTVLHIFFIYFIS